MKFSIRDFFAFALIGLAVITIVSIFLSTYTDFNTLKTGPAFLILFICTFIAVIFWMGYDKKIDKSEIIALITVAVGLTLAFIALQKYVPEIFSILPDSTKQLFSAIQ